MIKIFKYFVQSIFIYFFFLIGRIVGLKISRKIFSFLFLKLAPFFKSRNIIDKNLEIFEKKISVEKKLLIETNMWKNYGKTFIEYIFLGFFKKNNSHVKIKGEEILKNIIINNKKVIFVSGHFAN